MLKRKEIKIRDIKALLSKVFVFFLIFVWVFGGLVQIPFTNFPPEVQEAQAAVNCPSGWTAINGDTQCQRVLTSGTSITIPSNWSSTSTIEVIGGGGGANGASQANRAGSGGGGGAYTKIVNTGDLSAGQEVSFQLGEGGAGVSGANPAEDGTDTFFCNSTTDCASISGSAVIIGAKGGTGASGQTSPGSGGASTSGVPSSGTGLVRTGGGNGQAGSTSANSNGGGGGGAGGEDASGGNGASSNGGAGNNGQNGGGTSGSVGDPGGAGGDGTNINGTVGSGGGGGGANSNNVDGGNGGSYGAGGGGARGSGAGGDGMPGIIVITYTPGPLPEYITVAYRWFENNNGTQIGSPIVAQNTSTTLSETGAEFRLRMLLLVSSTQAVAGANSFNLQFATSTPGNCSASQSNYSNVGTASGDIRFLNNNSATDGASLTSSSTDPTYGEATTVNQTYHESNPFTPTSTIAVDEVGMWDFSLVDFSAPENTTYCFRVYDTGEEAAIDADVVPEIKTFTPPSFTQSQFRWYANKDAIQPDTALAVENATTTIAATSTPVRLRMNLAVSNADLATSAQAFKLQFTTSSPAAVGGGDSTSTAALSPGTVVSDNSTGTQAWNNPSNATSSDNVYARRTLWGEVSEYLKATNFGFNIPTNATIDGIVVEIERRISISLDSVLDAEVKLVKGGSISGTNHASTTNWTTTEAYYLYGSSADLWGLSLDPADINSSDFGVALAAKEVTGGGLPPDTPEAQVDHIRITVYYTEAGGGGGSWVDVATSSTAVIFKDNDTPADDAEITSTLLSSSTVKGSYQEDNPTDSNPNAASIGDRIEWDFSLDFQNADLYNTYYFRMVKDNASSTPLSAYTRYPAIQTGLPWLSGYRWFENSTSSSEFGTLTASSTSNPGGTDQANAIAIDGTHMYVVGYETIISSVNLRVEKRNLSDLALTVATTTSGGGFDYSARDVAVDGTYMYIVGSKNSGDSRWYFEKRNLSDLILATSTDVMPISGINSPEAIAIDGTYMYVAGYQGSNDWRMEKRNLSDLSLVSATTSNPGGQDKARGIAIDDTYMYVVGDYGCDDFCGWHIEKRNLSNLAVVVSTSSGQALLSANAIAIDGTHMYVVGYQGGGDWRMEKRLLSDLSLVSAASSSIGQVAKDIAIDGTHMYVVGDEWWDSDAPDWRIEKRNLSDLALVSSSTSSPGTTDSATAIAIDGSHMYVAGYQSIVDWRIEKRESGAVTLTPLASANTATTSPAQGTPFRLRSLLHASTTVSAGTEFKLQYAEKSGTCDINFSGESYVDVATSSGAIRFYNNSSLADGSGVVLSANDAVHASDTVVAQSYHESNSFSATSTISAGEDGLWDFALVDNSATGNVSYCFRIVDSSGATSPPLYVPEITTASGSGSLTLTLDPATLGLPGLAPGIAVSATSSLDVNISNGDNGYSLYIVRDSATSTLASSTIAFPDFTAWNPGTGCASGQGNASSTPGENFSFRVRSASTTANYCTHWWGADDDNPIYAGTPTSTKSIMNCTSCNDGSTKTFVEYRVDAPAVQQTGAYSGTVTYTVLANP